MSFFFSPWFSYRLAVVEELAKFGAKVHTCARNETRLEERMREWEAKGFQVSSSITDVTLRAEREKLMEIISSKFDGKLNILVGVLIPIFKYVSSVF